MLQGTINNPVNLDSDQEDHIENRVEQIKQNRGNSLHQIAIKSDFDAKVIAIREQIKGDQRKKDQVIMKRINKFFSSEQKSINPQSQYFRERREPNYNNQGVHTVATQLIIYGVDFLSTREIRTRFQDLKYQIKFLDDSHCKVIFNDEFDARTGFERNLKDTTENKIKLESQQIQLPKGWFQFIPYNYLKYQRRLQSRYSASNQDDAYVQRSNFYYKMKEAKRQYQLSCLRAQQMQLTQLNLMKNLKMGEGMKGHYIQNRFSKRGFNKRSNDENRNNYDNNRYGNRSQFQQQKYSQNQRRRPYYNVNNTQRNQRQNSSQNQSIDRSRNKLKKGNNRFDQDNLSVISRSISQISRIDNRKQHNQISLCQEKPYNNEKEDDDGRQSNLSFLLNKSQSSNSVINNMNKLKIDEDENFQNGQRSSVPNQKQKQSPNLSINSSFSQRNIQQKNQEVKNEQNSSFVSMDQQKKPSMKKANTSLIIISD